MDFLKTYADYIERSTLISWLVSFPKWGITKFFYWFCSSMEGLIDVAFNIFKFLDRGVIGNIYFGIQLFSMIVLSLTIMFIGYKMIFGKRVKIKDSLTHTIIIVCLIVNMPGIINKFVTLNKTLYRESKTLAVEDDKKNEGNQSASMNIIRTNVADLKYLADEGYDKLGNPDAVKNKLTEDTLKYADFQETLLPEDIDKLASSSKNEEAKNLSKYLTVDSKGKVTEKDIDNGWFSLYKEGTFRYGAKHGTMIVSFIVLSVFFFMQFCKLVILVVDLLFMKLYSPIVLASDIETGKKTKQMLTDIFGNVFSITALGISTSLFQTFYNFLVGLKLDIIPFLVAGVVGAVGFIKGSDSVAKYFGINTSVKEGAIGAMGLIGATKAGQMLGKGVVKAPKAISSGISKGVSGVQKGYQGATNGIGKVAGAIGKASGHISERGLGGATKDTLSDGVNALGGMAGKAKDVVTKPLSNATSEFKNGQADGLVKGHHNRAQSMRASQPYYQDPPGREVNGYPTRFNQTGNGVSDHETGQSPSPSYHSPGSESSTSTNKATASSHSNQSKVSPPVKPSTNKYATYFDNKQKGE